MTRKKRYFSKAYDAIEAFCNGNYEAYSYNIKCSDKGILNMPTCYSYSTHYPLIIKLDNCYLINTSGYSNTTAKHINYAYRILRNRKIIDIKTYFFNANAYGGILKECLEYIGKYKRARKYQVYYLSNAVNLYSNYENFCRLTLTKPLPILECSPDYYNKISAYLIQLYTDQQLKNKKAECGRIVQRLKIERQQNKKCVLKGNKENFILTEYNSKTEKIVYTTVQAVKLNNTPYDLNLYLHLTKDKKSYVISDKTTGYQVYTIHDIKNQARAIIEGYKRILEKSKYDIDSMILKALNFIAEKTNNKMEVK